MFHDHIFSILLKVISKNILIFFFYKTTFSWFLVEFPPSPTPINQGKPTKHVFSQTQTGASQENEECSKKKTGNYQPNKDLGLCVSWIRITSNPIVGTDQDGGTFWKRVAIF
jgi:hypothetical protein